MSPGIAAGGVEVDTTHESDFYRVVLMTRLSPDMRIHHDRNLPHASASRQLLWPHRQQLWAKAAVGSGASLKRDLNLSHDDSNAAAKLR